MSGLLNERQATKIDHKNGHHTGRDLSCWRCTLRAWRGRTPKPKSPLEGLGGQP